jgi:Flp pilus assembly pilin Flp
MTSPAPHHPARRIRGQSSTEMVIIVALVAIGAIGLVGFFGDNLRHLFGASSAAMAGDDAVANGGSTAKPAANKTLKTFGQHTAGGSDYRN